MSDNRIILESISKNTMVLESILNELQSINTRLMTTEDKIDYLGNPPSGGTANLVTIESVLENILNELYKLPWDDK